MCILSVYALLKVVGYYDLSVLSMSEMGFQKKFRWGWVDGVISIQIGFGFFELFNFMVRVMYGARHVVLICCHMLYIV